MTRGITFTGVGGQGALLVTRILAAGLINMGYDVKVSEVHGMAQRGGSVVAQLRFGDRVWAPIMAEGESDFLVAFEKMEAARHLRLLRDDGVLVAGDQEIPPLPVLRGDLEYPRDLEQILRQRVRRTVFVPARETAGRLGNERMHNIVLLGALIGQMEMTAYPWHGVMREILPEPLLAVAGRALREGMTLGTPVPADAGRLEAFIMKNPEAQRLPGD